MKGKVEEKLIKLKCPVEVFDSEEAYVYRRRRVAIDTIDNLGTDKKDDEIRRELALIIPKWEGIVDVETGEPLANPKDDPQVFARIDYDQLTWLRRCLMMSPRHPNVSGPDQT